MAGETSRGSRETPPSADWSAVHRFAAGVVEARHQFEEGTAHVLVDVKREVAAASVPLHLQMKMSDAADLPVGVVTGTVAV